MYSSTVTVGSFISSVQAETDISLDISDWVYLSWYNALIRLLYTEIVRETKSAAFNFGDVTVQTDVASPPFAGVRFTVELQNAGETGIAVYGENVVRVVVYPLRELDILPFSAYADYREKKACAFVTSPGTLEITNISSFDKLVLYYIACPVQCNLAGMASSYVPFPIEFHSLLAAKLRGDAYMIANEMELSANWINTYNYELENFKVWCAARAARGGRGDVR